MARRNDLRTYFERNGRGRQIHKWMHYFDVYDRHLSRFRGTKPTVVEFGIKYGGSLQMWEHYFGRGVKLYGVDFDPQTKRSETRRTTVFIGDQADRSFLGSVAAEVGPVDVVIDDGGHWAHQQIATFEVFYPRTTEHGVYLVEDTHTSYRKAYRGGHRKPGTWMDYAQKLTDQLNAFHSEDEGFAPDDFTRGTRSMHFYDSIVVFERGRVDPPYHRKVGVAGFEPERRGWRRALRP